MKILNITVNPDNDNASFDAVIVYEIIGADVAPQELQFALQSTR